MEVLLLSILEKIAIAQKVWRKAVPEDQETLVELFTLFKS